MSDTIDLFKVIELKKVLEEKFNTILSLHDLCTGQYFSVRNLSPEGKFFIVNYFKKINLNVIFNSEDTEFYLKEMRSC